MIKKVKSNQLFIIFSLTSGGSQRMLLNILNEIDTPHTNKILYLYNYYPNPGLEQQLTEDIKIYKYRLKTADLDRQIMFSARLTDSRFRLDELKLQLSKIF